MYKDLRSFIRALEKQGELRRVGVPVSAVLEIAEIKKSDLNANDPEMASRIIEGTARSMGIEVLD